ncbi:MAG: DEAD/DEAH box helicase [Erysipelotrichales bacterium]|nr:DEAD/DEAH box helicase [Erysipelotrichales bacterium]
MQSFLDKIKDFCPDQKTFNEGYSNFILKNYHSINHQQDTKDRLRHYFKALVKNDNINLSFTIHEKNGIESALCACCQVNDVCPHIVGFFLTIDDYIKKGYLIQEQSIEETDLILNAVNNYLNSFEVLQEIDIKPIITVNQSTSFDIELLIGVDKYYIIRDIYDFLNKISKQVEASYGKNLTFIHRLDIFTDRGKKIIEFLTDIVNGDDTLHIPNSSRIGYIKKIICISPIELDFLLNSLNKQNAIFYYEGREYDLLINLDKDPTFNIHFNEEAIKLSDSVRDFVYFKTAHHLYFGYKNYLTKLSKDDQNLVFPLFQSLLRQKGIIEINKDKSENFYLKILPLIKDKVNINHEFLKKFGLKNFTVITYLDFDEELFLKFDFLYNGEKFKEGEDKDFLRDFLQEKKYLRLIQSYGFDKRNNYKTKNFDKIIDDFSEFEKGLREFGEIYVSDTLVNIKEKIRKAYSVKMNIGYSGNMLDIAFEGFDFSPEELVDALKSFREKKKYHLLKNNEILALHDKTFIEVDKLLSELKIDNFSNVPTFNLYYLAHLKEDYHYLEFTFDEKITDFLEKIKNYANASYEIKPKLAEILKNYQIEGFQWLKTLTEFGYGGILADDMGLGKTIQAITLISQDTSEKASLIVCPGSLIFNWANEFKRFAPELEVVVVYGLSNERNNIIKNIKNETIYIISYDILRVDVEKFAQKEFRFMIIDEAQHIKNYNTQKANAVKTIKSDLRFALTGTPVENYLADLWSIFDFIVPGYLGSYIEFREKYEMEIVRENNKTVLNNLKKRIAPFILRRTKKQVLSELPEKMESIYYAKMDVKQRKVYESYLWKLRESLSKDENYIYVLSLITKLRQICASPELLLEDYSDESAKLELALELIEGYLQAGHKILLFSFFSSMLTLIEKRLKERRIEYYKMTGETKSSDRLRLTEDFNNHPEPLVFLISLKTGGVGLNLTGADVVIHYDPWWNLSVENQATDRSHRIGQKNKVEVIKLIVQDSIEDKIIELQQRKNALVNDILTDDSEFLNNLSTSELIALLKE